MARASAQTPPQVQARPLTTPVDSLAGVGPTRAKHLADLGVNTLGELLEYFPRTYQYESEEKSVNQLDAGPIQTRSEEHTSELQSRRDLVCRLLLEKKKKIKKSKLQTETRSENYRYTD